jgi:hypothetical protein
VMAHHYTAEVDQSGKIEQTDVDTILAFSDGEHYSLRIPARVKRALFDHLKRKRPAAGPIGHTLRIFSAGLYLLVGRYLAAADRIVIDSEYTGHDAAIRERLLYLIRLSDPYYIGEQIIFAQVGKRSPAHELAWGITRGERRAQHVVTEQELMELL